MSPYWPQAPSSQWAIRRWATAVWFGHPRSGPATRKLFLFRGYRRQYTACRTPNPVPGRHPLIPRPARDEGQVWNDQGADRFQGKVLPWGLPGLARETKSVREQLRKVSPQSTTNPGKATARPDPGIASAAVSILLRDAINPLEASRTTKPEVGKRRQTWPLAGDDDPRNLLYPMATEVFGSPGECFFKVPRTQPLHAGVRHALPRMRLAKHG
jgi:hypothetical protein